VVYRLIFIVFFSLVTAFWPNPCSAINASLWEDLAVFLVNIDESNTKFAQKSMARYLFCWRENALNELCDDFSKIESSYDDNQQRLTIEVPRNWAGLSQFVSMHMYSDDKKTQTYNFIFQFSDKSLTIEDILTRYGVRLAKVETNKDFHRFIIYGINSDTNIEPNSPLRAFVPIIYKNRFVNLTFTSTDKISVSSLIMSVTILKTSPKR